MMSMEVIVAIICRRVPICAQRH